MAKQNDKKDYDYDHGYMRLKDMQRWCGNQKFHDDVDKRLEDIRKEREEKKKKNYDLGKGKNWCGKKPDSIKMEESQLREFVSKVIKESLNEARKEINPGEIYRTLLGISDSMRDYAWVATNDMNITTAVSYLNKAIDAWKQVMRDNGAQ